MEAKDNRILRRESDMVLREIPSITLDTRGFGVQCRTKVSADLFTIVSNRILGCGP